MPIFFSNLNNLSVGKPLLVITSRILRWQLIIELLAEIKPATAIISMLPGARTCRQILRKVRRTKSGSYG